MLCTLPCYCFKDWPATAACLRNKCKCLKQAHGNELWRGRQPEVACITGVVGGLAGVATAVAVAVLLLKRHRRLRHLAQTGSHLSSGGGAFSAAAGPLHQDSPMAEIHPARLAGGGHCPLPGRGRQDDWETSAVQPLARMGYGTSGTGSSDTRYTGSMAPSNDSWLEMQLPGTSSLAGPNPATEVLTNMGDHLKVGLAVLNE